MILCEQCGREDKLDRHHDDYAKPDETRWLCRSCHQKWHKNHIAKNRDLRRRRSTAVRDSTLELLQRVAEREDRSIISVIDRAVLLYDQQAQEKDALLSKWMSQEGT